MREFVLSRPALQEMLKGVFQTDRKWHRFKTWISIKKGWPSEKELSEGKIWKEGKTRKGTLMSKLLLRATGAQSLCGLCRILKIISQRGKEDVVFVYHSWTSLVEGCSWGLNSTAHSCCQGKLSRREMQELNAHKYLWRREPLRVLNLLVLAY